MVARRGRCRNMFVALVLTLTALLMPAPAAAARAVPMRIQDLVLDERPGRFRLDLVFPGRPEATPVVSGDEDLLVWDFAPAVYPPVRRRVALSGVLVREAFVAQNDRRRVRLALRRVHGDGAVLTTEVVPLGSSGRFAFRVQVVTATAKVPPSASPVGPEPRPAPGGRRWVVVVDPGHGGKDPGASGGAVHEKDVVLGVAREVVAGLRSLPGVEVRLTRGDDSFVRLAERSRLAAAWKADLFVSLHCNSAPRATTKGFEVYTLSPDGASDEVAREVAAAENGVLALEGLEGAGSEASVLSEILCSMLMTDTMNQSVLLAGFLGKAVAGLPGLVNRGHRRANFYVLRLLKVPSVLVELGFLSNVDERTRMAGRSFQVGTGRRLAEGIARYLAYVQMREGEFAGVATAAYQVKPGDTLASIARGHRTSVDQLVRLNGLVDVDAIRVGQTLRVPSDPIAELLGGSTE